MARPHTDIEAGRQDLAERCGRSRPATRGC